MLNGAMTTADDVIPAKVLIVDDNEQNVELLQAYLEEVKGAETVVARDGRAALAAVAGSRPDLILLDVMMPKMSGFEVCKQLKDNPATREIPVIIITAINESGDYERGIESGANDFLTRPFNRAELMTRIRSLLRIKQMRREFNPRGSTAQD